MSSGFRIISDTLVIIIIFLDLLLLNFVIFRSTSKSRPNNIRGKKCLPVRTSVRPQKVSSI